MQRYHFLVAVRGEGLQEAGAPLLQAVRALPGLTLGGTAAANEPLLKLRFVLVHQKELSQQGVGLHGGTRETYSAVLFLPWQIKGGGTGQIQGRRAVPETLTLAKRIRTLAWVRCEVKLNVHLYRWLWGAV